MEENKDSFEKQIDKYRYLTKESSSSRYGCLIAGLAGIGAFFVAGIIFFSILFAVAVLRTSGTISQVSDRIAVIHIEGEIGTSGGVNAEEVIKSLKEIETDKSVKAVVLRIDSPGGAAAASQEIAGYITRMKKPVVASVGNSAASGAYWIASACDYIVCNPASSLGSIGVIVTIPNFEELAKKIGVKYLVIYKGKFKDLGNPMREITKEEKALLEKHVNQIYEQFIEFVAAHRKLQKSKVENLATGEVFTGTDAVKLGLADKTGDFYGAVEEAKRLAKIKGEPEIVDYDALPYYLKELQRFFPLSKEMLNIYRMMVNLPVAQ
ncbi:MAG: signal peptide peptidase SppA [Actinobacteria bacterium]|nr:signal peptide peptidase SppA [Actinomycetota bacterium]